MHANKNTLLTLPMYLFWGSLPINVTVSPINMRLDGNFDCSSLTSALNDYDQIQSIRYGAKN